jgi:CRP-like cAMP-binding protein
MPAIDGVARGADRVDVAAGEDVFQQGDDPDSFYVIDEGQVDVIGDGRVIRTLDAGDGFGEIAVLRDSSRTATVRARTPLRLYSLDRDRVRSTVSGYRSSAHVADAVVHERLHAFAPAH